jgi:hypothetical protein
MKKILLVCLLCTISLSVKAQQDTTKQKEEYCILSAVPRFLNGNKVKIEVDRGWETQLSIPDQLIKDEQEKLKNLQSTVDALNYMAKQGWTLATSYVVTTDKTIIFYYVLKRPTTLSN